MRDVLRLSLPLTMWIISFSALYGAQAGLCTMDWSDQPAPFGLSAGRIALLVIAGAAVLAQVAALALLATERFGSSSAFVRKVSIALATVALIATVWTALPVTFLPLCDV